MTKRGQRSRSGPVRLTRSSQPYHHRVAQARLRVVRPSLPNRHHSVRLLLTAASALMVIWACLDPFGEPNNLQPMTSWVIRTENARVGSSDWDSGLYSTADSRINGFILPFTVRSGDTLHFFVTAWSAQVSTSIYRLGWYDGTGARLVARHVSRPVVRQATCSASSPGPSVCNWTETDRFVIDPAWIPGVYMAKFADDLGQAAAYPFVVRSGRRAPFTVVLPFATYQAYNDWNGTSLYKGLDSTGLPSYAKRAAKVSFARPSSHGTLQTHFLGLDYLLVRWLEQNAFDVNYITDYDFHLGRGTDPQPAAWLFAGHSEYWTWPMWLRANAARAQGTSLGFIGGNDIYWVSRFETVSLSGLVAPVVVCYRDTSVDPDGTVPGLATVHFRSPPNNTPENSLVGIMSVGGELIQNPPVDLVVANGFDSLMVGTGLSTGEHIPAVAGWEGDRIIDNGATPVGIRVLFESPYVPIGGSAVTSVLEATVYRWPQSGSLVYASGDVGFSWGLSSYRQYVARPPLQRFLQNVLQALLASSTRQ